MTWWRRAWRVVRGLTRRRWQAVLISDRDGDRRVTSVGHVQFRTRAAGDAWAARMNAATDPTVARFATMPRPTEPDNNEGDQWPSG